MTLKHLDLFSGIGGFALGLSWAGGFETVAFCECDDFCQRVLRKHWPDTPIYDDVETLDYDGSVDIITGGYPCQPFSMAGRRQGERDDRHLWPAMLSLIRKHRPSWVIGENVAGHISMGLDEVLSDLEREGYAARTFVIPACALNAPHRRDRVWIVANTKSIKRDVNEDEDSQKFSKQSLGSNKSGRLCLHKQLGGFEKSGKKIWDIEPAVGRVANGIPGRLDRLKSLGNAVVPQILMILGQAIKEVES